MKAIRCDLCDNFCSVFEAVRLKLETVASVTPDGNENLTEWDTADVCRECLGKPASKVLAGVFQGFSVGDLKVPQEVPDAAL